MFVREHLFRTMKNIISMDKYLSIFLRQIEVTVYTLHTFIFFLMTKKQVYVDPQIAIKFSSKIVYQA